MAVSSLALVFLSLVSPARSGDCSCDSGPCNTEHATAHESCWEASEPRSNQNCSSICPSWSGVFWADAVAQAGAAGRRPDESVSARDRGSWATEGGALELLIGTGLHCTMVYFTSKPSNMDEIIEEAMSIAPASPLPVKAALREMWGCGSSYGDGACSWNSALFDATSDLALFKYKLMDHFAAKGLQVETTLWGGTAHTQIIWAPTPSPTPSPAPSGACPKTCSGYTCDEWHAKNGRTCAYEEEHYGCDCSGCLCPEGLVV